MIYKDKKIAFPAKTLISFSKLIGQLKEQSSRGLNNEKKIHELIEACQNDPRLIDGFDANQFDSNNEIVLQLCSTLFPYALRNNEIKGVIPPFEFRPFYLSDRFEKILSASGSAFSFELSSFDEDQMYIFGCNTILQFYYGYPSLMTLPNIVSIATGKDEKEKTYRLVMNGDLLEIAPAGNVPDFKETDWLELLNDFDNILLWKRKFPPGSWIMKGIGIVTLFDISSDHAIAKLTSKLLTSPLKSLEDIVPDMGRFLEVEDLNIGFLDQGREEFATGLSGFSSVILDQGSSLKFKDNLCAPSYQKLIVDGKAIVITDVKNWNQSPSCSTVSTMAEKAAAGSYLIIPVTNHNTLLGYLELASLIPYKLNGATLLKLNVLLPTLAMAISRNRNEFQNKIEALIQQKCTTIHPSVKWRFEEESIKYLENLDNEEDFGFNDIAFPEVYPLYGQLDISSSSKRRNEAVQADLLKQLNYASELLNNIWSQAATPIQEEMLFRLHNFQTSLQENLYAAIEQSISYFLVNEIHPILKQKKEEGKISQLIADYFKRLQPDSQTLYEKRKQFDKHISIINQTLASRLDKKQALAQQMFPHYFERYKTDGVEFNMYIGQSITRTKSFSHIDLQNLQLWQLMSICELEREYKSIKNRIGIELSIASLVLVYSTPITIHFRMDEKKFDVDGAYNARYEIIKKRIDKAYIKGTTERITCPGKIAIIYGNDEDAAYYKRYISFLQSKKLITQDPTEEIEVEDLPGVNGLKALRIAIEFILPVEDK